MFRIRNGAELGQTGCRIELGVNDGIPPYAGVAMTPRTGDTHGHSAKSAVSRECNYYIPMFSRRIGRVIIRVESSRVVLDARYSCKLFREFGKKNKRIRIMCRNIVLDACLFCSRWTFTSLRPNTAGHRVRKSVFIFPFTRVNGLRV